MEAALSHVSGSVVDSIIEELRAQEGALFQKPQAQELYSVVRRVVIKTLGGAYADLVANKISADKYAVIVNALYEWHAQTAAEEVKTAVEMRANPPFGMLLEQVAFSYAKMLYRKCDFAKWSMKRPNAECLLRGVYTRLADPLSASGIRSGKFFQLDPIKQDYVLRQVFREALSDCIEVYERTTGRAVAPDTATRTAPPTAAPVQASASKEEYVDAGDVSDTVARALAVAKDVDEGDGVPEGDVFPSDSISSVIGREKGGGGGNDEDDEAERPRLDLPVPAAVKPTPAPAPVRAKDDDLRSVHSKRSTASAASTGARSALSRASQQQRKPRVLEAVQEDVPDKTARPTRKVVLTYEEGLPPRAHGHRKGSASASAATASDDDDDKKSTATGTTATSATTRTSRAQSRSTAAS